MTTSNNKEDETTTSSTTNPAPRQINYPAFTWDYRLVNNGKYGLGLVANRNIKKGKLVFSDSYEFLFTDVASEGGDLLRFDRYEKAARRCPDFEVPSTFALNREVLTRTHGVPVLQKNDDETTAGTVSWVLEVPGMLINHSCDPNVIDDSHDSARGEAYAARDIRRGEELTYDYTFQYYDHGPFFQQCFCGSGNKCRGKMMGFKALTDEQKQQVLPFASEAIKAMHEADTGKGLPVHKQQATFPPRCPPVPVEANTTKAALRMVVPGPSHAHAPVLVQRINDDETGSRYGLYAAKDFQPGQKVYEFWTQLWPGGDEKMPIDMTFSTHLLEGDPQEGEVIRVYAWECAKRDRDGKAKFSGWDLLTQHSATNPALTYNDRNEDEDDDWHAAYAARAIQKGELLTVDFNSLLWDRTIGWNEEILPLPSHDARGFRFLSPEAQEELKNLSCRRTPPPHHGLKKRVLPGEALAPHVRVCWRAQMSSTPGVLGTSSSSSSSSDDASSSSSSEEED